MKRRKIVIYLITVPLLNACSKVNIRSDIKDFVASFSLTDSIATYKEAGYTSVTYTFKNNTLTTKFVELYFNIKDISKPVYSYTEKTKIGEEDEKISKKYLELIDNKIYFVEDESRREILTELGIYEIIEPFFFKSYDPSDKYHSEGMYYGDLVLKTVRDLQGYVTINEEKSLYIFDYSITQKVDAGDYKVSTYYSVNKLGMMVKNISKHELGRDYLHQEINVYNIE